MRKTIILALAVALVAGAAYANFCSRDTVPAATLLVPYILIDTDSSGNPLITGNDTITTVTNVSSNKEIIHITVYAADSSSVIDFDEVLSGYDVWQINWRDLLTGHFDFFDTGAPATGDWDGTLGDLPQPFGPTANNWTGPGTIDPPVDFDATIVPLTKKPQNGCGFPWGYQPTFAPLIVAGLQLPLVAIPGQDTNCDGTTAEIPNWGGWLGSLTDQPLFFYAYIDVVSACNGNFPEDAQYWSTAYGGVGAGFLTEHNVLMGYDFYTNPLANFSESLPTVNVEAVDNWNYVGLYSTNKADATGTVDQDREPLPTAWAFNYLNNSGITTEVAVWKNYDDFETIKGETVVRACLPYVYYAFDENEHFVTTQSSICPSPYGSFCLTPEPNVFPFQTQKVPVTPTNFDGLKETGNEMMGWMLLVFDPSIPNLNSLHTDEYLQTYVFAKYNWGTYTTSVEATVMSNRWCFPFEMLPYLNTYDGETNPCLGPTGIIHTDVVCVDGIKPEAVR